MTRSRPLALFGLATRYVTRIYLLQVLAVIGLILALVLAIDLAGHYQQVMSARGTAPLPEGTTRILAYLALRAAYNLPSIVPIATAVGIIWAEFRLARTHQRSMIANTARSRTVSLVPALIIGLLAGSAQVAILSAVRPASVDWQAAAGFRDYGPRFRGGETGYMWLDINGSLLHTRIRFEAEAPVLIATTVYSFDAGYRLTGIAWADRARPGPQALRLEGAQATWSATSAAGAADAAPTGPAVLPLAIDPVWLGWAGVEPRFVPQTVLRAIASAQGGVPGQDGYRAVLQERRAAVVTVTALAVLVAVLSLRFMRPRQLLITPLAIAASGYAAHVLGKAIATLGEYERLAPIPSAWAMPVALLSVCVGWAVLTDWRVRRRLAGVGATA